MITVTAYEWVPEFARGHVRDLRARWALNEAGRSYEVKLIDHVTKRTPAFLALQPFGQVPVYADDEVTLFESGAIVLHIAETSDALMPADVAGRAQVTAWVIAALNSLEPWIGELGAIDVFHSGEAWTKDRRPQVEAFVRGRLTDLAAYLKDRDWLVDDRFTAADLMIVCVLRSLGHTDLVTADPVLGPYLEKSEARPAFRKALADQLADFDDSKAPGKAA